MASLPIELLETKLISPVHTRAPVPRTDLVARLSSSPAARIITIVAAPGFGKTTLLTEWSDSDERPFAWLSLDERDNDPIVFLTYVAVAFDQVSPLDVGVFEALATALPSVEGKVIPRLTASLAQTDAVVLVLDDVHVLTEPDSLDALTSLLLHLPESVQVALSGRAEPALPLPRMRAEGTVLDIGPHDLAFDAEGAKLQMHDAGIDLTDPEIDQLMGSTEGWPAGLYLAALSMRTNRSPSSAESFAGDDPFVGDYLRAEFLQHLSPEIRSFLLRTSVLDEMCGPLCDAILERQGSAVTLESLARQNLLVIPRDRHEEWYRYHHLLRGLLLMELRKLEPDLVNELRSRAAHWYEAEGHHDVALDLAQAADDADHAARLFKHVAIRAFRDGRLASAMRWLAWFDEHNYLHEYPLVALAGAWLRTLTGEAEGALALSTYADGQLGDELLADEITTATAWAAQLRALWCRDGVETMRRDAESAFDMTPEASSQRAPALLFCGMAKLLQGDDEAADADFVETIEIGSRTGSSHAVVIGFAERAGISIKRGDWKIADELSQQALSCIGEHHLEEYPTSALAYVMAAHATFHQRGDEAARDSLIRAQRLRVQLTYSVPWLAVQTRLESARTYLAMADPAGARAVVREAEMIFRRCPDLGVLRTQLEELKRLARDAPTAAPGISTLTSAELRLLPLLATHLTFPEMGDRLFVSRHTVKSQAISIYRKLEVSSRSEAVQQAGDLGLLER